MASLYEAFEANFDSENYAATRADRRDRDDFIDLNTLLKSVDGRHQRRWVKRGSQFDQMALLYLPA